MCIVAILSALFTFVLIIAFVNFSLQTLLSLFVAESRLFYLYSLPIMMTFFSMMNRRSLEGLRFVLELFRSGNSLSEIDLAGLHGLNHGILVEASVVFFPEIGDDGWEGEVLFFHFLVVTPALFCLPGAHEVLHAFEDFVHASHLAIDEMLIMNFQEPVVSQVFLVQPVTPVHVEALNTPLGPPPLSSRREHVRMNLIVWRSLFRSGQFVQRLVFELRSVTLNFAFLQYFRIGMEAQLVHPVATNINGNQHDRTNSHRNQNMAAKSLNNKEHHRQLLLQQPSTFSLLAFDKCI